VVLYIRTEQTTSGGCGIEVLNFKALFIGAFLGLTFRQFV